MAVSRSRLRSAARALYGLLDLALLPVLPVLAAASRLAPRRVAVGLGPLPLINSVYHKRALERRGYSAETFVHHVYHITDDFDVRLLLPRPLGYLARHLLFVRALFRYRILYHSFDGGSLGDTVLLAPLEPLLYRLAGIRTVVLPYGSDVQDLRRCPNPGFVEAMRIDYPGQERRAAAVARRIRRWSRYADHIVSGCDWVDYTPRIDTSMLSHFAIDVEDWDLPTAPPAPPLRVLHAPNHRAVKGTVYLEAAVEALRNEGLEIELVLREGVPNQAIREAMATCHVVADQFVIGWYAMFAVEAMAARRPTLCFVRDDLESRFVRAGLLEPGELPLLRTAPSPEAIAERLRQLAEAPATLGEVGDRSRDFVVRHHSLEAIGGIFESINRSLGVAPERPAPAPGGAPPRSAPGRPATSRGRVEA